MSAGCGEGKKSNENQTKLAHEAPVPPKPFSNRPTQDEANILIAVASTVADAIKHAEQVDLTKIAALGGSLKSPAAKSTNQKLFDLARATAEIPKFVIDCESADSALRSAVRDARELRQKAKAMYLGRIDNSRADELRSQIALNDYIDIIKIQIPRADAEEHRARDEFFDKKIALGAALDSYTKQYELIKAEVDSLVPNQ